MIPAIPETLARHLLLPAQLAQPEIPGGRVLMVPPLTPGLPARPVLPGRLVPLARLETAGQILRLLGLLDTLDIQGLPGIPGLLVLG